MTDGLTPAMGARINAITQTVSRAVDRGFLDYIALRLDLSSLVQLVLAEARSEARALIDAHVEEGPRP